MALSEMELIGQMLVKKGFLEETQLADALKTQKKVRKKIGEIVIRSGLVSEERFMKTLSEQLEIPLAGLDALNELDLDIVRMIPEPFAREHVVVPMKKIGNVVEVAMTDPENIPLLDNLKKLVKCEIKPFLIETEKINKAIDRCYEAIRNSGEVETLLSGLEFEIKAEDIETDFDVELTKKEIDGAPIVKFVNVVLHNALKDRATDIHIEPSFNKTVVRCRIDGALQEVMTAPSQSHHGIVSRIKIMSKLNIAESRLPQDGRFTIKLPEKEVDVRVSIIPSVLGEKIVLRLLDKGSFDFKLASLGFEEGDQRIFEKCISMPYGIIIISGPTGSGKSTTLYSALKEIKSVEDNIITVEDPVEYQLEGITQVSIHEQIGLTFGDILRRILRQDPDKILIGEIRDYETADIAMKFALTGHLVFTTLHANDAASTITRLVDLGVAPFLVGSSLVLVMAQRLVRKVCKNCRQEYKPTEKELMLLDLNEEDRQRTFYSGKGCAKCRNTGYFGRTGIFEMMPMRTGIKNLIFENANQDKIRREAVNEKMVTLRQSALKKLFAGETSVKEVLKTTTGED